MSWLFYNDVCKKVIKKFYFITQFLTTAPTGVMSSKSFLETFENMVSVTHGMEQLPDVWLNITPQQVGFYMSPPWKGRETYCFFPCICPGSVCLSVCMFIFPHIAYLSLYLFIFLSLQWKFLSQIFSSYWSQCFKILCTPSGRQSVLCKLELRCLSSFCLLFFNFSFFPPFTLI